MMNPLLMEAICNRVLDISCQYAQQVVDKSRENNEFEKYHDLYLGHPLIAIT